MDKETEIKNLQDQIIRLVEEFTNLNFDPDSVFGSIFTTKKQKCD